MPSLPSDQLLQLETTCGSLLYELQLIWDEMGETDDERDKMLLQLEQECLEVYRRKVDQANRSRAQLHQAIADYEAELASIYSALGDRPVLKQADRRAGSLKEQLEAIAPQLEEMRRRKEERIKQILDVKTQIQKISNEIAGCTQFNPSAITVDENDLSLRNLEEYQKQLQALQKEKSDRLYKVIEYVNTVHGLCSVLGLDFLRTVTDVHPSLDESEQSKSISNDTIERLAMTINSLQEEKKKRMQKLQDLATTMLELWNLMDTPIEEQQMFQNVTCNIAASEHEICAPNALGLDFIDQVESEVARLEELKGSKMKELVLKKRTELEEICRKTHLIPETNTALDKTIASMDSGLVDPSELLESIEEQIAKTKEEAFSRKDILEKIEKWLAACEEESWLEDYNKDENRYSASRGAHLTLKRAERARAAVSKLPGMVECLIAKTTAWEKERGKPFLYDGIRLLSMLEEYSILRQEKEQERRRQRDQKRLQGQLMTEQEALFGSKPSPAKPHSAKKALGQRTSNSTTNRRLSLGGAMLQPPTLDFLPPKATVPAVSRQGTPQVSKETKRDRLQYNLQNQQEDDYTTLSAGRRGLDVAGLPTFKHPFYATTGQENEANFTQQSRRPLSPVPTASSQSNANSSEDFNKLQNGISPLKTLPTKSPLSTPFKRITVTDEENTTPCSMPIPMATSTPSSIPMATSTPGSVPIPMSMTPVSMPIPMSTTPGSVTIPMQSTTPIQTPTQVTTLQMSSPLLYNNSTPIQNAVQPQQHHHQQHVEYSFEERRAGFVLLQDMHWNVLKV
eukprot:Gb_30131 [translate_table: standard]